MKGKIQKIFFIGFGAVGYGLSEIFNRESLYLNCDFTIIEPKKDRAYLISDIFKDRKCTLISEGITRDNYRSLLDGVDKYTFIINVSVNVDSIDILRFAKERDAYYIDTSIEQYEDHIRKDVRDINSYSDFKLNNLFHQNIEAMKALKNSKKTRVVSGGFNPGMIQEYVKKGLKIYGGYHGLYLEKGDYAKLGNKLGLKEIQIVEYDSQIFKKGIVSKKDAFVSDWSAIGFQEEASDLCMVALSNSDMAKLGDSVIKPEEKGFANTHVGFLPHRGMNVYRKSITVDHNGNPFEYEGMLIPHAEVVSLSEFFTYKGDCPSIMYIYRPCKSAIKGLEYFKKNNYKILAKEKVVLNEDVVDGWDSIGALLHFENGERFWSGCVLGKEDVDKMGFKSNATIIQVAGFMNAAIKWVLSPKGVDKGLINAEDINHEFIFKHASKYMGREYFTKV